MNTKDPADAITLTPTEDLILTLLASRRRLGEGLFRIPTVNMVALRSLQEKGLVHILNKDTDSAIQVSLSNRGLVVGINPGLSASLSPETCQSFYIGPRSSEHQFYCDKKFGHRGKEHRYTAYGHLKDRPLRWTDAEAGGLASARYGDDLRRHEAERRTELTALVAELRPGADVEHYLAF